MSDPTLHCNVLTIANCGILILGEAGSGKSSLTMGLLERAHTQGLNAHLNCDDQAHVEPLGGKLAVSPPRTIAGKIELRGYGIVDVPFKGTAIVHLVVQLVDDSQVERIPEKKVTEIKGITLPLLEVPKRHEQASIRIIFAWLADNILSDGKSESTVLH